MSIDKKIINQRSEKKNMENVKNEEHPIDFGSEAMNEKNEQLAREERNREEFLNELGIFLLSEDEIAEMSFSEVISYQEDIKEDILEAKKNLPPKDLEASKEIFDEVLNRVNIVKTPADLKKLKSQLKISDTFPTHIATKSGHVITHNPYSRYNTISKGLYGRRKLIKKPW